MGIHGDKRHNLTPPSDTNLGTLPAVANAGAPSLSEGLQVGLSVDLKGGVRSIAGLSDGSGLLKASINFSGSGDNTLVAGSAQTIIRVYRLWLVVAAATNLIFKDGTTALNGAADMSANGGLTFDHNGEPWFVTGAGNAFVLNSSSAVQIGGMVYYTQG